MMYNLFISGDETAWEGPPFFLERPRCVNEFTSDQLKKRYGDLSVSSLEELQSFPGVFAYEKTCEKDPEFAYITRVKECLTGGGRRALKSIGCPLTGWRGRVD